MAMMTQLLAQIDPAKITGDGMPPLAVEYSWGMTWVIIALVTAGILFVAFKTSKRNSLDRT